MAFPGPRLNVATQFLARAVSFSRLSSLKGISGPSRYSVLPQSESSSPSLPSLPFNFSPQKLRSSSKCARYTKLLLLVLTVFTLVLLLTWRHLGHQETVVYEFRWQDYKRSNGFFRGLRTLVPISEYRAEYPPADHYHAPPPTSTASLSLGTPAPYSPYSEYGSKEYLADHHPVKTCYLDGNNSVPAPSMFAFGGVPQHQPEPILGSYEMLGLRNDVCFDRYARYGPYGLGYGHDEGGIESGLDSEHSGKEEIWKQLGQKIDYRNIDWDGTQRACYDANKERFSDSTTLKRVSRSAVIIRSWTGYPWDEFSLVNFRAMITELSLKSGGEYDIHFLVHVKDNDLPIWASEEIYNQTLESSVPKEFRNLVTLWSEAQMEYIYNKPFGDSFENTSGGPIHGAYRSLHFPLQYFAQQHQEYDHFWNWEMDMRYLGNYYELFDRMGNWARDQSRVGLWERNAKFYIPALHGSWDNFTNLVETEVRNAGLSEYFLEERFPGYNDLGRPGAYIPSSCDINQPSKECGIGEEADLICLTPIFDPNGTDWLFRLDVTGYNLSLPMPPRRNTIIAAGRFSRRLLNLMHEESAILAHSMWTEMWGPSVALHHGLKAVYAPHPVYIDRQWDLQKLEDIYNGGVAHSSGGGPIEGGKESVFSLGREHNLQGTSWYYNSGFSGALWRRWLGFIENGEGGRDWEAGNGKDPKTVNGESSKSLGWGTGRMCLRSMLFHPIKFERGDF